MLKSTIAAASLALGLGLAASAASAAPSLPFAPGAASAAEKVAVVCIWRDGRWGYMRGKAFVKCRPVKPRGSGWLWFKEGGREGWYHRGRKEWHHKNW